MKYWLMKSEPNSFSIDDLMKSPQKTTHWDGVRNYQARNMMRDDMKKGDKIFFYHSNCKPPGIAGIAEVVKEAYIDFTAHDPDSKYFDPKSTVDKPRWMMVDIQYKEKFPEFISLDELKQYPELQTMRILQKGNRLSITPITQQEWTFILQLRKT